MWKFLATQGMSFSFMVYLLDVNFSKMKHGVAYKNRSLGDRGQNHICVQEEQDGWESWLRRSRYKHCDNSSRRGTGRYVKDTDLPELDCVERSVFKRGPSRRTYQIRVLEARYPCEDSTDTSEHAESGQRQHKDCPSKSARFVHGNNPFANPRGSTPEKKHRAKRKCRNDRRSSTNPICRRVFQALGDNVLIEWLMPEEVHNTEIAFRWEYDWGRAWHGGKVKHKAVAARIQFDLQMGLQAEYLLEKYNHNLAFSAFWYLVDVVEVETLANKYRHLKTIRKLCALS